MQRGSLPIVPLLIGAFILILGGGGYALYESRSSHELPISITSFEECAAAGYPIMESYPRQCGVPDGPRFTEIIDENAASCAAVLCPIDTTCEAGVCKPIEKPVTKPVSGYEDCVKEGGAQFFSMTGQTGCNYNGQIFIKAAPSACTPVCESGQYCENGTCAVATYNTSCTAHTDCKIINKSLGYSCCHAGACATIDYSKENWVSVNAASYARQRAAYCPNAATCGPPPGCPDYIVNINYEALCRNNACIKGVITQ